MPDRRPRGPERACDQRTSTEPVDRWIVSTIECDPEAGRFSGRDRLEVTYVTDGAAWLAVRGRVTSTDDLTRWEGRPLRGAELEQVRTHAVGGLVAGRAPWTPLETVDGCEWDGVEPAEDELDDGHLSSWETRWCPLDGGGVSSGYRSWMSESGYHTGRESVELISITPRR